jgi:hypothetical protein
MTVLIVALALVALILAILALPQFGGNGYLLHVAVVILAIVVLIIVAGPHLDALKGASAPLFTLAQNTL